MRYSLNTSCIGKDTTKLDMPFVDTTSSLKEFVELHYIKGYAISGGIFTDNKRSNENWLSSSLIIVDIDDGSLTLEEAKELDIVQRNACAIIPSSSYTHELPKFHIYFELSEPITDKDIYKLLSGFVSSKITETYDRAVSRQSQAIFGTSYIAPSFKDKKKTLYDGLVYYNEIAVSLDVNQWLLDALKEHKTLAHNQSSEEVSARAEVHNKHSLDKRVDVVIDALDSALKGWGRKDYSEWLSLVISAYVGCDGHNSVREFILSHKDVYWQNDFERQSFYNWWQTFKPRDAGTRYTVATLFYMARLNGWLRTSPYDIVDYEEFYAEEVSDFILDKMPRRALVMSQTGTGKTKGAINLIKKLGVPKTVLFAPSIKLCTSLSKTLSDNGVPNLLYIDNGATLKREVLIEAQVLVTTLQTFGIKVAQTGFDLSLYELVIIDESDDLIGSFVRSETGHTVGFGSHVTRQQGYWGIYALKNLLNSAHTVLMLDGTATQISETLGKKYSPALYPFRVYKNTFLRPKADVTIVSSLYEARKLVHDNILKGKKVVVACDTKRECELIHTFLILTGALGSDDIIVITSDTHHEFKVKAFFHDVELGASSYKCLIYNSAMGSGVSIETVEAEVLVQICNHISPRKNLQVLNRFRKQGEVYVYVGRTENLYNESAEERLSRLEDVMREEIYLTRVTYRERNEIAQFISELSAMSVGDELAQKRSVYDFYTYLLENDGRQIQSLPVDLETEEFKPLFKQALDALKERKNAVMEGWRYVDPISRDNPVKSDIDPLSLACGLLHARIQYLMPEYEDSGLDDMYIAELCLKFGSKNRLIERMIDPHKAMGQSISTLQDEKQAQVTFKLDASKIAVIALLGHVFKRYDNKLRDDEIDYQFVIENLEPIKSVYNSMCDRSRVYFDELRNNSASDLEFALGLLKNIAKAIGLKIKREYDKDKNRVNYLEGSTDLVQYLRLKGHEIKELNLEDVITLLKEAKDVVHIFNDMPEGQKKSVQGFMNELGLSLQDAIGLVNF